MLIYHLINRGVDGRSIFQDDEDRVRFIHDMFEFNDTNKVDVNYGHFLKNAKTNNTDIRYPYIARERKPRTLIVNIYAFCLMNNHYHLMISPLASDSTPLFMRKLNGGYSRYFNNKYKRSGALFKGRYKTILLENESHFIHLPYYIHLNPLDYNFPEWRKREIGDVEKALNYLLKFRWSSHLDYWGIKNFPSVTQREFLQEFFDGQQQYRDGIRLWLEELKNNDYRKEWIDLQE